MANHCPKCEFNVGAAILASPSNTLRFAISHYHTCNIFKGYLFYNILALEYYWGSVSSHNELPLLLNLHK